MSAVHLHLLLSHVPVIGMLGVAFLLLIAFVRRGDETARIGFAVAVFLAIAAGVVFLTGESSEHAVESVAGISEAAVEAHEEASVFALWFTIGVGVLALVGLAVFRRRTVARGFIGALLLLSVAAGGVLAWTANLGGSVRHTEITSSAPAGPATDDDRD